MDENFEDSDQGLAQHLGCLKVTVTTNKLNSEREVEAYKTCWSECATCLSCILDILRNDSQASDETISSLSTFAKLVANEILKISRKKSPNGETDKTIGNFLIPVINTLCQLVVLFPSEKYLWTNNASRVFELWFIHRFPSHQPSEKFCILYLLSQLVKLKRPTQALIKRTSLVQAVIKPEDLDDSNIKNILIQVSQSKFVIKSKQGVNFLAFLFTLRSDFVEDLHNALKEVIPGISKDQAQAYGMVYYKAWLKTSGDHRNVLSECCIQNFMQHAVGADRNVPRSRQIFYPVLTILNRFHKSRNSKETQMAVVELWRPILRFHLFAPNSNVRLNACECFFSAFPLENPKDTIPEKLKEEATQVQYMLDLLDDSVPEVRVAAVRGVCRVLAKYWRILSIAHINRLFKDLIEECSCDGSSFLVRKAVLQGMAHMVRKCPYSRKYLKEALPTLSGSLFDQNEGVRQAMVDLLMEIRNVKEIKFWDVSPMEDLLYQLSNEKSQKICMSIVELLKPSYFPEDQNTTTKLERCIHFVQSDRQASRKFYQYLPQNTSVISCVGFILESLVNIKRYFQYIEKENERSMSISVGIKRISEQNLTHGISKRRALSALNSPTRNVPVERDIITTPKKEPFVVANSSFQSDSSICTNNLNSSAILEKRELLGKVSFKEKFDEPNIIVGFLDALCFLLIGLNKELFKEENAEFRRLLHSKAAGCLRKIFPFLKNDEAFHPMVYMSSLIQKSLVRNIESHCWSRIVNDKFLPTFCIGATPWNETDIGLFDDSDLTPLMVDVLCNWGRAGELLDILNEWLSQDAEGKVPDAIPLVRSVRFAESETNTDFPKRAVCILDLMLNRHVAKSIILEKHMESLEKLAAILEDTYLPKILKAVESEEQNQDEFLLYTLGLLLKIRVILFEETSKTANAQSLAKFQDQIARLFKWQLNSEDSLADHTILQNSSLAFVMLASRLVNANIFNQYLLSEVTCIVTRLLQNASDSKALRVSIAFAIDVCGNGMSDKETLTKLVLAIVSGTSREKEWDDEVLKKNFTAMKSLLVKSAFKLKTQINPVLQRILEVIVAEISREILKAKQQESLSPNLIFPPIASFWFDILAQKEEILEDFVKMWSKFVLQRSTNKEDIGAQIVLMKNVSRRPSLKPSISNLLEDIFDHVEKSFFELDDPELDYEENSFVAFVNSALDETQAELSKL